MPKKNRTGFLIVYLDKLKYMVGRYYTDKNVSEEVLNAIINRAKKIIHICEMEKRTRFPKEEED